MADESVVCPACEVEPLRGVEVPNMGLFTCPNCGEIFQRARLGNYVRITELLHRNELGDDRVRAATSSPRVSTVKSFLEVQDSTYSILKLNMAEAQGGLRTLLAQIENRIDFAISKFTGMDLVSDGAGDALAALREARELVSTTPTRKRGGAKES